MSALRRIGLASLVAAVVFLGGLSSVHAAGPAVQTAPKPVAQQVMPEVFSFPDGKVKIGEPATIKWSYPVAAQVRLLLFRNGAKLGVIVDGLSHNGGVGQYEWQQAGHYNGGTAPLGGGYKIKVRILGKPGVFGMSKFPFNIFKFEETPEGLTTAKPKLPFNIAATKITRGMTTLPGGKVVWDISGHLTTTKPLDVLYGKLTITADDGSFQLVETERTFNVSTQYPHLISFIHLDVPANIPLTIVFEADYDNRWNDAYKEDNKFTWKTSLP